jgi:hypothetical protein
MRYIKSFANDSAIQEAVDNKTLGKPYVALNESAGTIDWNGKDIDYSKMYLTIEALKDGDFYIKKNDTEHSVNGGDWVYGKATLSLSKGDTVRLKGTAGGRGCFSGNTLDFNVYGNIESLEYGDDFIGKTNFVNLRPYADMFKYCNMLINSENLVLPVTTLNSECYANMFEGCTGLITAPNLPAGVLANRCYKWMFFNCNSLNYIKCLATDISVSDCLNAWVGGVSPTGTFVKKAGVEWSTGASGIPDGWTVIEE